MQSAIQIKSDKVTLRFFFKMNRNQAEIKKSIPHIPSCWVVCWLVSFVNCG